MLFCFRQNPGAFDASAEAIAGMADGPAGGLPPGLRLPPDRHQAPSLFWQEFQRHRLRGCAPRRTRINLRGSDENKNIHYENITLAAGSPPPAALSTPRLAVSRPLSLVIAARKYLRVRLGSFPWISEIVRVIVRARSESNRRYMRIAAILFFNLLVGFLNFWCKIKK